MAICGILRFPNITVLIGCRSRTSRNNSELGCRRQLITQRNQSRRRRGTTGILRRRPSGRLGSWLLYIAASVNGFLPCLVPFESALSFLLGGCLTLCFLHLSFWLGRGGRSCAMVRSGRLVVTG